MGRFARRLIPVLALAVLAAACGKGGADKVSGDEMSIGDPNAKATIIEYASVTCPHCARFNEDVFPLIKKKYIDTGKVRYVFREFLTPPENVAAAGFLLARCAGKDKYFNVIDALFHSQQDMLVNGNVREGLFRIGRSVGLTDDQTTACVQDDKALKALQARVDKAATDQKIEATPTFLIGGKKAEGEQKIEDIDATLQPLLK